MQDVARRNAGGKDVTLPDEAVTKVTGTCSWSRQSLKAWILRVSICCSCSDNILLMLILWESSCIPGRTNDVWTAVNLHIGR